MTRTELAVIDVVVRQVHRGFWTYDLIYRDEGCRYEYSIGECHSRRDAEKQARAQVKAELLARRAA